MARRREAIRELWEARVPADEIARKYAITENAVRMVAFRWGWTSRNVRLSRREAKSARAIEAADRVECRKLHDEGKQVYELAEWFGWSVQKVSGILGSETARQRRNRRGFDFGSLHNPEIGATQCESKLV